MVMTSSPTSPESRRNQVVAGGDLLVLLLRVNAVMQHADGATCVVWTGITEAKTLTVEIRSQMVEASLQFLPPQVPNRVPWSRRRKHLECRLYRC